MPGLPPSAPSSVGGASLPQLKYACGCVETNYVEMSVVCRLVASPAGATRGMPPTRPGGRIGVALLVAFGLAATTLISGCGASQKFDPVARAATVSSAQAGVRFTLDLQIASTTLGRGVSITGQGYADQRMGTGRLSLDFAGLPAISELSGTSRPRAEIVFSYPTIYMQMPFLRGQLPAGKSWTKLDLAKLASGAGGSSLPEPFSIGQIDPAQLLRYLRAGAANVLRQGTERIYGVMTTRYRVTLRLDSALEQLPRPDRSTAKTMLQRLGNGGAVPIEVWVDSRQRVRRVRFDARIAGSMSGKARITIGFAAYGPVPAVKPPSSGEVVDLTDMYADRMDEGQSLGRGR